MIDVTYSCAVCGGAVTVVGISAPTITRACGHDGAKVYADMAGTLFGRAWLEKLITLEEIPDKHRAAFAASMGRLALTTASGDKRWRGQDWVDYINGWHLAQAAAEAARIRLATA